MEMNSNYDVRKALLANAVVRRGFKYLEVPLDLLNLSPEYQRDRGTKANDLVRNWDDRLCDDILVSFRDGEFNVVDGQGRCMAARQLGRSSIGCKIIEGLTLQDEAMVFATQTNGVRKLTSYDRFRAEIIAEDKTSLEIKKICEEYNVRISKPNYYETGSLYSLSRIKRIYVSDGEETIRWIFDTIKRAGWHDVHNAYSERILSALQKVYKQYTQYSEEVQNKLILLFRKDPPDVIAAKAKLDFISYGQTEAITAYLDKYINDNCIVTEKRNK